MTGLNIVILLLCFACVGYAYPSLRAISRFRFDEVKFPEMTVFMVAVVVGGITQRTIVPGSPTLTFDPDIRFWISLTGKLMGAAGTVLAFEFVYRFFKPAVDPMSLKTDERIAQRRRNFFIGLTLIIVGSVIAFLADLKLIG
jgi:hypothetical protein